MGRDSHKTNTFTARRVPFLLTYDTLLIHLFEIADPPTKACIEFVEWKPSTQASFLVAVRCSCHASASIQSTRDIATSIVP